MNDIESYAAELLAAAPTLLADGYLEEVTLEALVEYAVEAKGAEAEADEEGGAASWNDEDWCAYEAAVRAALAAAMA